MRALLVAILAGLPTCGSGTLAPGDDTAPDDDTSTMGPCESGICSLEVTGAWAECGKGPWEEPAALTATPAGPGALDVLLLRASPGCCPTVAVTAEANVRHDPTIEAWVDLSQDECDCACLLDVGFRLDGIPAGSYTVRVMGSETAATVE